MKKDLSYYLMKIDRLAAWVLLLSMFFYFITGYGMTKGIISGSFSTKMHLDTLPIFVIVAFVIHTSYAVHLALKRWRFWNPFSKIFLFLFYTAFLFFFIFLEIFYNPNKNQTGFKQAPALNQNSPSSSSQETEDEDSLPQNVSNGTSAPSVKTFSVSELAKYNGQNGQPAYVAVDGVVYDVTSIFVAGKHYTHLAGTELTNAFYSRHVKSQITKYPEVGVLN